MHKALRKTPIWYHNLAWMLGEMGESPGKPKPSRLPGIGEEIRWLPGEVTN